MWLIYKQASGSASRVVWELGWTLSMSTCSNHTSFLVRKRTTRCSRLLTRAFRTTWGEGEFHRSVPLPGSASALKHCVTVCVCVCCVFLRRESCNAGEGDPPLYVNVNMCSGEIINTWIDSLQAFFPGLQVGFYNRFNQVLVVMVWFASERCFPSVD